MHVSHQLRLRSLLEWELADREDDHSPVLVSSHIGPGYGSDRLSYSCWGRHGFDGDSGIVGGMPSTIDSLIRWKNL